MADATTEGTADDRPPDPVDALLDEVLATPEAQWPATLAALCQQFPEHAEVLRRRFRCLQSHGVAVAPLHALPGSGSSFGDYDLGPLLGHGAMGVVFDARHRPSGESIALKILRPELLDEPKAVQRFRQEAALAAGLDHPHLCRVRGAGSVDDTPFLAMQRIVGDTLAERILRARRHGPAATPNMGATVQLLEKVARGLGHLHGRGLVHRDVKPGNILVTAVGEPVLCDFGLAWSSSAASLTRTGAVLGTPAYMAPEQLRGAALVSPQADVYSLGATLFEALTLRPPFDSAQREDLYRRILTEPADPVRKWNPAVPRALATVVGRCLEKDPRRRYANGDELADDLERLRTGRPVLARPPGLLRRSGQAARRRPVAASLTLAAVFALLFLLAVALHLHRSAATQSTLAALAAERLSGRRPAAALLLALELFEAEPSAPARSALMAAMLHSHQVDEVRHGDAFAWACPSPDGTTLLIGAHGRRGEEPLRGETASIAGTWSKVLIRHGMFGACAKDGRFAIVSQLEPPNLFDRSGTPVALEAVDPPIEISSDRVYQPRPRMAFDAPGNLIVGDRLGRLHQFDPAGRLHASWRPHEGGAIHALWLLGDGLILSVAVANDRSRLLHGIAISSATDPRGTPLRTTAQGEIRDVGRSGDGRVMALALQHRNGGTASILRIDTQTAAVEEIPLGSARRVFALAVDEHGEHFVVAADRAILTVDRAGAIGVAGMVGSQPNAAAFWSSSEADHDLFAIGEFAGPIHVLSLALGRELRTLRGHTQSVRHLQFSPDGSELISAGYDGTARRWRMQQPGLPTMEQRGPVFAGAWLPDGEHVVLRTEASLSLWDRTGRRVATAPVDGGGLGKMALAPAGHPLSRDGGGLLAVGAERQGLQYWRCRPGDGSPLVKVLEPAPSDQVFPMAMAFTRDGWLVAGGSKRIRVYDPAGHRVALTDEDNLQGSLADISLAPDGHHLATCGDGILRLWRLDPASVPMTLHEASSWPQPMAVKAIAFAPEDGTHSLLVGRADGTVACLDTAVRTERFICRHDGLVNSVSWSSDGQRILSCGNDGLARVHTRAGEPVVDLPHGGIVWDARFSPNGDRVLTCGSDGSAHIWPIEDDELQSMARAAGFGKLGADERARLVGSK